MTSYACHHCHRTLETRSAPGTIELCPACKSTNPVPAPDDLRALPQAPPARRRAAPRKPPGHAGAIYAILALIAVGGGVGVGVLEPSDGRWFCWLLMGVSLLAGAAILPGLMATSRGLSNARAIGWLGVLGMIVPIVWLVALIAAALMQPPRRR